MQLNRAKKKARIEVGKKEQARFLNVNLEVDTFKMKSWPLPEHHATINPDVGTSHLDIFLNIVTSDVLFAAWDSYHLCHWKYSEGTIFGGKYNEKWLYIDFALYIFITGQQNAPKESETQENPRKTATQKAHDYLSSKGNGAKIPSVGTFDKLFGRFHLRYQQFSAISKRFRACLRHVGRVMCGDEKLLYFTGDSGFIRLVPSKPDKIGLWFFENCVVLKGKLPFLIYARLSNANTKMDMAVPAGEVVREWADIALSYRGDSRKSCPILVFDSYYMTQEGRRYLNHHKVPFIGSVPAGRCKSLVANLPLLLQPGDTEACFSVDSKEMLVGHYDIDASVGKKYVLSNNFRHSTFTKSQDGAIPVYEEYKVMFNTCDKFNRAFHDRLFPHRSGGHGVKGEEGHCHKYIMGCILQNVFNLYDSAHNISHKDLSFKEKCEILSVQLFKYACPTPK